MDTKFHTKKLSELGGNLPLGFLDPTGAYVKDMVLRPWRMKEERELGELRDKNRDVNVATYASMVLASMCTQLGPHDFEKLKHEERRVIIGQMTMGDVFYAYIWLRVHALGPEFSIKVTCPNCGKKSVMEADLNSVDVKTVEKIEDAQWEYKLSNPFMVRQKQAETLIIGPARWNSIEMIQAGSTLNTGVAKAAIIRGSVQGVNGEKPVQLAESELDEMSKRDLEKLTGLIDARALGPEMVLKDKCPKCSAPMRLPIDWGYDSFFANSSPSQD